MRMSSHSREIPARFLLAKAASGEIISLFCRGSVFLQKRTWRFPCTSTVQIKTAYLYCRATRTVRIAKRCTTVVRVRVAQEMHAQLHTCHVNYDSCHTLQLLFPELRKYGSTSVRKYGSTKVLPYFRTIVVVATKVRKYLRRYLRTTLYLALLANPSKVRKYFTFETPSKVKLVRKYILTRNITMRRSIQKYHTARYDDHDVISARTGPDATFNIAFSG